MGLQGEGGAVAIEVSQAKIEHQGGTPQDRSAQPHQHPLATDADAFTVESVVLAGDRQKRSDPPVARQGLGEGVTALGGIEGQPQAAEHMGIAALPVVELQGSCLGVVRTPPQAVGAHQPEAIAVTRQPLEVRFAIVLASGKTEVPELHGAEVAVEVIAEALQPVEVASLITLQPQHPVDGHQGGELLPQPLGLRVTCGRQLEEALVGRVGQGQVGGRLGHGGKAGASSLGRGALGGVNVSSRPSLERRRRQGRR